MTDEQIVEELRQLERERKRLGDELFWRRMRRRRESEHLPEPLASTKTKGP